MASAWRQQRCATRDEARTRSTVSTAYSGSRCSGDWPDTTFTWPAIKDGMMALNHTQFEALFSGLDWRKVKALETRPPAAAE